MDEHFPSCPDSLALHCRDRKKSSLHIPPDAAQQQDARIDAVNGGPGGI